MKRIKKNQVIITAVAIMIAVAGYINYAGNLSDIISVSSNGKTESDQDNSAATSNPVDEKTGDILSNDAEPDDGSLAEPGSAILTSGNVSSSVISEAKLNREQIRAKTQESLITIINDASLDNAAKTSAVNELAAIADYSEKEVAIELLLEAKGFTDAVASVSAESVDVVVNCTKLEDNERAQIEDIVKRKTGLPAEKITINICK